MKEFYTPAEVGAKMGTSGTLVRTAILQGADGWRDVKYFMCGRNMKIPSAQFSAWFNSKQGETMREKIRTEVNHRKSAEQRQPVKVKAVRVKRNTTV